MKLSVIIPVFNEEQTIIEVISRIQRIELGLEKEIIIVDDASTDSTKDILKRHCVNKDGFRVFFHAKNMGKSLAIRTALQGVTGDIVIIQDADLEYNPQDYPQVLQPILSGKADVVYGSRFTTIHKWLFIWHWFGNHFLNRHYEIRYLSNFLGIQLLNTVANILYNTRLTDIATCYKVCKAPLLTSLTLHSRRFEFCYEVTAKLLKKGYKIYEVPITYHPRSIKQGKKLRWYDGIDALYTLIRYRFFD